MPVTRVDDFKARCPCGFPVPLSHLCLVSGEDVPEQQAGWCRTLRAAAGSWHRRASCSLASPRGSAAPRLQPASRSASFPGQRFPSPAPTARVPPQLRACSSSEAAGFELPGLRARSGRCGAVRRSGELRGGGVFGSALPPAAPPAPRDARPGLCRALRGGRGD